MAGRDVEAVTVTEKMEEPPAEGQCKGKDGDELARTTETEAPKATHKTAHTSTWTCQVNNGHHVEGSEAGHTSDAVWMLSRRVKQKSTPPSSSSGRGTLDKTAVT